MNIETLKKIAVIGAGDMGHGIAQVALMAGYSVNLYDISEEAVNKGKSRIFESLDKLQTKGKISAAEVENIKSNCRLTFSDIRQAVEDVDFVIEVVPEREDIKIDAFRAIDAYAPARAIIATNTSTMSILKFAQATNRPDRVVGMHFFNPVVLMRLVEVIQCETTSEETVAFACAYVEKLGKKLIRARKDRPGFIANRIAAPVIVYNGLRIDVDCMDPADIDLSMLKLGQKMGPMELADYTGIDVMNCVLEYYHTHLCEEYAPSKRAAELVANGHSGRKSGRGYYEWPEQGRPGLNQSRYTGDYDPDIPFFIQANEACKLVEEGVCTFTECDDAMVYGYNTQGPLDYIRQFDTEKVASALTKIAEKYGKEIFKPSKLLQSGAYLKES